MTQGYRSTKRADVLPTLDFRRRHEDQWLELEVLIDRVLHKGLSKLSTVELQRMTLLYRRAMASVSLAREIVLDQALVVYLESLAARAHLALHNSTRARSHPVFDFLWRRFPGAVRAIFAEAWLAFGILVLGVAVGWVMTLVDPAWFYAFVDEGMAAGRSPAERTSDLRDVLYVQQAAGSELFDFAGFLFTHNVEIGFLAFALGFVVGLPTAYLLFTNGLTLGAFTALYFERGLGLEYLGWLLPHGIPELAAVVLCGAAGLSVGRAVLFPGAHSPSVALQNAGRNAAVVVTGCVLLFLAAGAIEGIFRQIVVNESARLAVAILNLALLSAWISLGGRANAPNRPTLAKGVL